MALAEGELQRLAPKIEGRGLTLETSLGLAATTGDAGPIRRLIANLNENAIDHNVEGGRVEIRTESAAALTVSNTGPRFHPRTSTACSNRSRGSPAGGPPMTAITGSVSRSSGRSQSRTTPS